MAVVVDVLFYTRCVECLVWWMSGVVNVRCGGCLVWWMSYFMDGVADVCCGGCVVWWMSFFTHGVVDVWCGGCLCGGCRTIPLILVFSSMIKEQCLSDRVVSMDHCGLASSSWSSWKRWTLNLAAVLWSNDQSSLQRTSTRLKGKQLNPFADFQCKTFPLKTCQQINGKKKSNNMSP